MCIESTTPEINLRLTALQMPLIFLKRIPGKLEGALAAIEAENAQEFTRQLTLAARLRERANSTFGNAAKVNTWSPDTESNYLEDMIRGVLSDCTCIIDAVQTTLGRHMEKFLVEEDDVVETYTYRLDDSQAVQTVKDVLYGLTQRVRQRIRDFQ